MAEAVTDIGQNIKGLSYIPVERTISFADWNTFHIFAFTFSLSLSLFCLPPTCAKMRACGVKSLSRHYRYTDQSISPEKSPHPPPLYFVGAWFWRWNVHLLLLLPNVKCPFTEGRRGPGGGKLPPPPPPPYITRRRWIIVPPFFPHSLSLAISPPL